jgi:hypothetical protein
MGGAGRLAAAVAVAVAAGDWWQLHQRWRQGDRRRHLQQQARPSCLFKKNLLFLAIFKINIILYMYICLKETVGTKGICMTPRDLRYYPQRVTVCAGMGYSRNGI